MATQFEMRITRPTIVTLAILGIMLYAFASASAATKLRITIPRHSELTPVQRFNREGVSAIQKHDYEKAEGLFYKAYLYDPADPFTLYNLGYISELEGHLDRADKFYKLADEQGCDAVIDKSSTKQLVGKPMLYALGRLHNNTMRVNMMNIEAMDLLAHGRAYEAASVLKRALTINPRNPFTLNNLGVAEESAGDFSDALTYYDEAAASGSNEPVVVTLDRNWRGRPVSKAATDNAQQLRERMGGLNAAETQAVTLTLRGVSLANRNDWAAARRDFLQAYALDPTSAFTLNNRAYVAEKQGDMETAQFYYSKARRAADAGTRVGLATNIEAQGLPLAEVAGVSNQNVDSELNAYGLSQKGLPGPIKLIPRGSSSSTPTTSPQNAPQKSTSPNELEKQSPPQ